MALCTSWHFLCPVSDVQVALDLFKTCETHYVPHLRHAVGEFIGIVVLYGREGDNNITSSGKALLLKDIKCCHTLPALSSFFFVEPPYATEPETRMQT